MKKLILGLLSFCIPYSTLAQNIELELIRTEHAPGFFAVRIFPDPNLPQIDVKDIFVKNFDKTEAPSFQELILVLEELNSSIIEKQELLKYQQPYNRIILLGGERNPDFIQFLPKEKKEILTEFDRFASENLKPPTLLNIRANFGGNIAEVYPKKIHTMSYEPIFFVGKFKSPIKTKMEITALTHEGEIIATTPLKLGVFEKNEFSDSLPQIWEEVYHSTLPRPPESQTSQTWISIFPWLLGVLGIVVTIFAIIINTRFMTGTRKKQDIADDIKEVPPGFWHQSKERVDDALPFEVSSKRK